MDQLKMNTGKLLVKPIYTMPSNPNPIIDPNTNRPAVLAKNFADHPYRALVVFAPDVYHDGGFEYKSEIKEGDMVYLPGEFIMEHTDSIILDGIKYPSARYMSIVAYRTPAQEERDSLVFKIEEDSPIEVVKMPLAQA
jgi:hypothetical protein